MDLGAAILEDARDGSEGGEAVGGDFRLGFGDFGEQGGFSDRGEADEGDSGVWGRGSWLVSLV